MVGSNSDLRRLGGILSVMLVISRGEVKKQRLVDV
jgi:hypothetical protein